MTKGEDAEAEPPVETKGGKSLSAVAAGRDGQTGTTKTGGQISPGGASRGGTAKAAKKDATPG